LRFAKHDFVISCPHKNDLLRDANCLVRPRLRTAVVRASPAEAAYLAPGVLNRVLRSVEARGGRGGGGSSTQCVGSTASTPLRRTRRRVNCIAVATRRSISNGGVQCCLTVWRSARIGPFNAALSCPCRFIATHRPATPQCTLRGTGHSPPSLLARPCIQGRVAGNGLTLSDHRSQRGPANRAISMRRGQPNSGFRYRGRPLS